MDKIGSSVNRGQFGIRKFLYGMVLVDNVGSSVNIGELGFWKFWNGKFMKINAYKILFYINPIKQIIESELFTIRTGFFFSLLALRWNKTITKK